MRAILHFCRTHPVGIAVVLVWLLALSRLVQQQRSLSSSSLQLSDLAQTDTPGEAAWEDWMGLYYQGEKIGYAHSSCIPEGAGYRFQEESFLKIAAQGFPLSISMKLDSRARQDFGLQTFVFELQAGLVNTSISGRVEGDLLKIEMNTAGNRSSQSVKLDSTPTLSSSLTGVLRSRKLAVGETFSLPAFDPLTMRSEGMTVSVLARESLDAEGRKIPVYRLRSEHAGLSVDLWVDDEGRILKQSHPSGWDMVRETREDALTRGWKDGARMDLVRATSVKASGVAITAPREAAFLSVLLPLNSVQGLDLNGGRQQHSPPDRYRPVVVTREDLINLAPTDLPVTDPQMKPFLAPDMFVQSDDPQVREQALRISGGEKNSLRVAGRIMAWMHEHIEQRAVPSLPNAVEVLRNRVGDCNEFTVLYVALARALGLPARAVAGLVYLDGRFYYHAWPQVYAGGWIMVDPVFGQMPADATHIRLVTGGIEKQMEIAKIIGKLKEIHVLDVKYD